MIGRFKFRCIECKADNWLTRQERDRRALPTCSACGCRYLDPVTEEAKDRIARGGDAARAWSADADKKRGITPA